jgi:hypothetical protein
MSKENQIKRGYRKTDNLMLEQAQVMHDNYVTDQALFLALSPDFSVEYGTRWQEDIDAAEAVMSDTQYIDSLQIVTQTLYGHLVQGRSHYQKLAFHVRRAFAGDTAVHNYFGADKYNFNRRTVQRMRDHLLQAHNACSNPLYHATLVAKGFTLDDIELLLTIEGNLREVNRQQENLKSQRPVITKQRITTLNKPWACMVDVSEAAKIIFKEDPVKLQQYLLYPEAVGEGAEPKGVGSMAGVVKDETGAPLLNVLIQSTGGEFTDRTTSDGEYLMDNVTEGTYDFMFIADGFKAKTVTGIKIKENDITRLDVSLEPAGGE